MKRKLIGAINPFLKPLGVELSRIRRARGTSLQPVYDPSSSYMKSHKYKTMLIDELSSCAKSFFSERVRGMVDEDVDLASEVAQFLSIYSDRRLTVNTGGSGFHNAFWIFLFARALRPSLIVESGVWKGHTSWLLEQACPDATILGFDINLKNLEYRGSKVRFFEMDWSTYEFEHVNSAKSLVFFDCHVNHAKRILESHEKGFSHILFDDNPPVHKLYGYGLPGFPTASMLYTGLGLDDVEISWCWQGCDKTYRMDGDEAARARDLIKIHAVLPDVGGPTRYGGFSFLTYVQL